jgi:hypothetical protein
MEESSKNYNSTNALSSNPSNDDDENENNTASRNSPSNSLNNSVGSSSSTMSKSSKNMMIYSRTYDDYHSTDESDTNNELSENLLFNRNKKTTSTTTATNTTATATVGKSPQSSSSSHQAQRHPKPSSSSSSSSTKKRSLLKSKNYIAFTGQTSAVLASANQRMHIATTAANVNSRPSASSSKFVEVNDGGDAATTTDAIKPAGRHGILKQHSRDSSPTSLANGGAIALNYPNNYTYATTKLV